MLFAMRQALSRVTIVVTCCVVLVNCGGSATRPAAQTTSVPTASALPNALSYLRPIDGVMYAPMAPETEARVVSGFGDAAISYAVRDVAIRGIAAKLRIVVLWMTEKYAATKPLNDLTGLGGPGSRPETKMIGGLTTFLHTDVSPNILVWQQGPILALIYGYEQDRPAMESLAGSLITSTR